MSVELNNFDVIIIGGGPAGCATALSIAGYSKAQAVQPTILIIDDAQSNVFKIGESLPAAAKRTFSKLCPSLLARLSQDTKEGLHDICSGNASAWASPALHETHALMNPYGAGWHLDRAYFDETLRESCGAIVQKGRFVAVRRFNRTEAKPKSGATIAFGWEIDVEMNRSGALETLYARWVVDTTGRRASFAHKVGAKTRKHSELLAFYLVFDAINHEYDPSSRNSSSMHDRDTRTLIEAAPSGWWYTARLPHGKRLVTYTTSPSDPTARIARTVSGFLDLLHSQTTYVTHMLRCASDSDAADPNTPPLYELLWTTKHVGCVAAGSSVLEPCAAWESMPGGVGGPDCGLTECASSEGRGWCAVGDAALAFDPLSSQGMITALDSGMFVGSVLARHFQPHSESMALVPGGEGAVRDIGEAYEKVRVKYEQGRAYYYDIIRQFETGSEPEANSTETMGFWESQRVRHSTTA